jgi:hypothetical protein
MTQACSSLSSTRERSACELETSSTPTAEQAEAGRIAREKADEAEAEARRNAYFASSEHEGGRCRSAMSDAGAYSPETPAQLKLRDSLRTAGEMPLEDDAIGNGLVGAAGAGAAAGLAAAGARSATTGLQKGVLGFVTSFVKGQGKDFVLSTMETGPELPKPADAPPAKTAPATGGRTGARGTSEVAPEPNRSEAPPVTPGPVVIRG